MTSRAASAGIAAARALGLTPDVLALLDHMSLPSRRPVLGDAGQRRSRRTGGSVEFADFRAYVPGDDFRRVDWNAYARHERLIVRLHSADEDVTLTLWIDTSASMAYGDPSKLHAAASLAGALGYVALGAYDRACVATFASTATMLTPRLRGRSATHRLWLALAGLHGDGRTDFGAIGRAATRTAPGIAVIISDFLSQPGPDAALAALRGAGQEPVLVRLLSRQEVEPDLQGDLRLVDAETGTAVEVTVTPATIAAYRSRLAGRTDALRTLAARHRARWVDLASDTGVVSAVRACRSAGIVR
ncbi:MAG TPA: DUF58 domain-containing protein [Candidatus Saccharimonadales bacterium]|nr:DUF58 domain-containing protein [Candidatus Saccharimonadales bacterium]